MRPAIQASPELTSAIGSSLKGAGCLSLFSCEVSTLVDTLTLLVLFSLKKLAISLLVCHLLTREKKEAAS